MSKRLYEVEYWGVAYIMASDKEEAERLALDQDIQDDSIEVDVSRRYVPAWGIQGDWTEDSLVWGVLGDELTLGEAIARETALNDIKDKV